MNRRRFLAAVTALFAPTPAFATRRRVVRSYTAYCDETVDVSGATFTHCTFVRCTLVGAARDVSHSTFTDCGTIRLKGPGVRFCCNILIDTAVAFTYTGASQTAALQTQ